MNLDLNLDFSSRLVLGTVQFGLPYGVANQTGQPSHADVVEILACAIEGGVRVLDTAATYGQSEEVLGRALAELGAAQTMTLVSKVEHLPPDLTPREADRRVEASVLRSLSRLGLERLPVCLLHRQEEWNYLPSLQRLQERGLVGAIGVSTTHPEPTQKAIAEGAGAVQIPANLLDWRFWRAGVLKAAQEQKTAVFVRSIYLQGLLAMPETQIPAALQSIVPVRRHLETLAHEVGLSLMELAARTILSLPGVSGVVVGVETVAQMKGNLELFARGPLDENLVRAVKKLVPPLPETILLPQNWAK